MSSKSTIIIIPDSILLNELPKDKKIEIIQYITPQIYYFSPPIEKTINLFYYSPILKRKNQCFLIYLLHELPENYKLTFYGDIIDENYYFEMIELILNYDISKRITIKPLINYNELTTNHIHLYPSLYDGYSPELNICNKIPTIIITDDNITYWKNKIINYK